MKLPSYRLGILIAFLIQIGLLGWLIVDRAMLLSNGREVRLAVVPVDPRDLFRGDYVVLRYPLSTLRSDVLEGDDEFDWQEPVYVTLTEGADGIWSASAMTHARPAGGVYLAGAIARVFDRNSNCTVAPDCREYDVTYNLEQFFVPEGEGRALERLRNDQKMAVDVAVAANGRAALKRLLVDGEPRFEEKLY